MIFVLSYHRSNPLSAGDFNEFFLALSKRFAAFANCLPQFQALSSEDRDSLLIYNTPLYLQESPSGLGQETEMQIFVIYCHKRLL